MITKKLSIYIKDERCLRLIQNDKLSSSEQLLEKDEPVYLFIMGASRALL